MSTIKEFTAEAKDYSGVEIGNTMHPIPPFDWQSFNPNSVSSAKDLPGRFVFGAPQTGSFKKEEDGWSCRYGDDRNYVDIKFTGRYYQATSSFLGISGTMAMVPASNPKGLSALIPQLFMNGIPSEWDQAIVKEIKEKYTDIVIPSRKDLSMAGIPDGPMYTVFLPLKPEMLHRVFDEVDTLCRNPDLSNGFNCQGYLQGLWDERTIADKGLMVSEASKISTWLHEKTGFFGFDEATRNDNGKELMRVKGLLPALVCFVPLNKLFPLLDALKNSPLGKGPLGTAEERDTLIQAEVLPVEYLTQSFSLKATLPKGGIFYFCFFPMNEAKWLGSKDRDGWLVAVQNLRKQQMEIMFRTAGMADEETGSLMNKLKGIFGF